MGNGSESSKVNNMKRCPRCKSDALEADTIQYFQEFEGQFFIIENVPVQVCDQCSEIIVSETIAEKIQNTIWSGTRPKRTQQVSVYEVAFQ